MKDRELMDRLASRKSYGHFRIIRNAIRCNICGDEIESTHRHDFVTCKCGTCSVDGGHSYLRRCGDLDQFTDISECIADVIDEE